MFRTLILLSFAVTSIVRADLARVKLEPNLEKRSELALIEANTAIDEAKKAYEGDATDFPARVDEIRQAVELSY